MTVKGWFNRGAAESAEKNGSRNGGITLRQLARTASSYFTAMLTGAPGIHAAWIWMVAVPGVVSGGTRKFTW